jgi:hypothetical protein
MKEFASHTPTVALTQDPLSATSLATPANHTNSTTATTKSNASAVSTTKTDTISTQTSPSSSLTANTSSSSLSNASSTTTNQTSSTSHSSSNSGYSPLTAGINFVYTTQGSDNSVQVTVGINDSGGLAPFTFIANWSDGINQTAYWNAGRGQTNGDGVFIRSFLSNQTVPSSVEVQVKSSDGQSTTVNVTIPPVSATTSAGSTQPEIMGGAFHNEKQVINLLGLDSLTAFPLAVFAVLLASAKMHFIPTLINHR